MADNAKVSLRAHRHLVRIPYRMATVRGHRKSSSCRSIVSDGIPVRTCASAPASS